MFTVHQKDSQQDMIAKLERTLNTAQQTMDDTQSLKKGGTINNDSKLRSEIVWHRFFAVPAFIRHFRSYIAVRKLLVLASPNFSSRFCACASFWQSPDILGKIMKLKKKTPAD